jgi:sugar/nucleoside kinase (ribokinase family)
MVMKKILGIGNALVDIIIFLNNDAVLQSFSLPRGGMQLVDMATAQKVEEETRECRKHMASGGSAANTIHGLAALGVTTGFVGSVGHDQLGDFFREDLIRAGITPLLSKSNSATGSARALVSKDGERTMATFLGAAVELAPEKLDPRLFKEYDHLHLEGYLVLNHSLVEMSLDYARQYHMTVSLDLASYNVVEANLDFLTRVIQDHVDVVFANEEEARAFTGHTDPGKALEAISSFCDTAVVKIGEHGSLIFQSGKTYRVAPVMVNCLDTTGAGDLYASGFLYGFASGMEPEKCGKIGSLLAAKVIEEPGAKISPESWDFIRKNI